MKWEGRQFRTAGVLLGSVEPAKGGEWRWFLSGWGGSKKVVHDEATARREVEQAVRAEIT